MLRQTLGVVVAVVVGLGPAAAAPKAKSWPTAGRCLPVVDRHSPCVQITAAQAAAIHKAVLAALDPPALLQHPEWRGARKLAERPLGEYTIGGFKVDMHVHPSRPGDVVRLTGVEAVKHGTVYGFRIYLAALPLGRWAIVEIEPFAEPMPEPWV